MPDILACPDHATILRSLGGGDTPQEVERIAAHIEGCTACGAALDSLLQNHETAVALRDGTVVGEDSSEVLRALHVRLAGLVLVARPADQSEQTVGLSAEHSATCLSGSEVEADVAPAFLRPSQQPDEIGRLGTYRILKKLGAGGMGMVFLAEDTQLRRKVALKTMQPAIAQHPQHRERFLREARAAAAIEHAHIVAIFQVGEDNGVPYLAMPFLKGESLEDRLRRSRQLPVAEAVRIADEMAEGLVAAHAEGLIHRDIKPANVWLESQPARGATQGLSKVKLLDFGLARSLGDDTHLTQSGAIVGTPAFMAPEQARGQAVDGRSDLFSLGCVLYTMLTGDRPFRGDTTMSLLTALALDTPKTPRQIVPGVSAELSEFVMRLLAKRPEDRPASAEKALDELRGLAHIAPEIVNPAVPLPKPTRARPRLLMAIAAGLLFALLGGGAWFYGVTIVRVATNKGELVVEVDDADIEVSVKQGGVTVADRKKDRTFVLTAKGGEVEFFDPSTGVRLLTKEFKLERGGKVVVRVREELAAARKIPGAVPDRKVAERVLKDGGSVRVECDGAVVEIYEITKLPDRPFKVVRVNIGPKGPSVDVLLENLRGLGSLDGLYFMNADLSNAGLERLASLPNLTNSLKAIHLIGVRITDTWLAHLKRFRKLTTVEMIIPQECEITAVGLKHLSELPALESLAITGGRITDAGLRELRGLKLTYLALSAPITDAGIEHLLGMTTLENLLLHDTSVGDAGLGRLKALPALHSLLVRPTGKVTDAGLKSLAEFPKLRAFVIESQLITDKGLAALKECKQLRILRLHNTRMTDADVAHLSGMTNLVELDLYGATISDAGLEHLKGLKGLVTLGLSRTKVTKAGVQKLAAALPGCNITSDHGTFAPGQSADPDRKAAEWVLKNGGGVQVATGQPEQILPITALDKLPGGLLKIQAVEISRSTDDDLNRLRPLERLVAIRFFQPAVVTDTGLGLLASSPSVARIDSLRLVGQVGVTDAGLAYLKKMKALRILELQETKISGSGLANLTEMQSLTVLMLDGCKIADTGLEHLRRMTALRTLGLRGTGITASGLEKLSGLKVQHLQLGHNPEVTDAGLAHLPKMAELNILDLDATPVTDIGLEHLKSLKQLTTLRLVVTKVTAVGVKKLASALPGCTITSDHGTFGPNQSPDPDRKAAEWVLKNRGSVQILVGKDRRRIDAADQLPREPFHLVDIVLYNDKSEDGALELFHDLTKLQSLSLIDSRITDERLSRFAASPGAAQLVHLGLQGSPVTDECLAAFRNCRQLHYLGLSLSKISGTGLAHLQHLPLRYLLLDSSPVTKAGLAEIRKMKLTHLALSYAKQVDDDGLAQLEEMTTLTNLNLHSTTVSGAGLRHLAKNGDLVSLNISGTRVAPGDLDAVLVFQKLQTLHLHELPVPDAWLAKLEKLTQLKDLSLYGTPVTDAGLDHLKRLKKLKTLMVAGTKVTAAGVKKLAAALPGCTITSDHGTIAAFSPEAERKAAEWVLSIGGAVRVNGKDQEIKAAADLPKEAYRLTGVNLERNPKVSDAGLAHFENCKNLTTLNLALTQVGDAGLAHFKGCTNLTSLNLHHTTRLTDAGLAHFEDCKNLTTFDVALTQVGDAGLTHFKGCKNLTSLSLKHTQVGDAGLAYFKDCTNLTFLDLGATNVSDAGLAHFKDCKNLTFLELFGCKNVGDAGLAHLEDCKKLRRLRLTLTKVSDAGLAHLKTCKQLTSLELEGGNVSDAGLAHLKECKNLEYLALNSTKVSDAGLAHLKDCKNLTALGLAATKVGDASLEFLAGLPSLVDLRVQDTRISKRGIDLLKAARPKCNITWSEPNRTVAEQVLALGGSVTIGTPGKDDARPIKSAADLPLTFFQMRRVSVAGVTKPIGDLIGTLSKLHFAEFDRLESIDLSGMKTPDLAPLMSVVGLRELSLAKGGMTDEMFATFPKFPTLRRLVIDDNAILGAGLARLGQLPELRELSLRGPTITDLLAQNLAEMKKLTKLSLVGTPLTDASVKHLKTLTALTALDLLETKFTAAGIDELKKALPKCKIEWDGGVKPKGK